MALSKEVKMLSSLQPELRSLAVLFIHKCGMDVSEKGIEAVLKSINVNVCGKDIEPFVINRDEIERYTQLTAQQSEDVPEHVVEIEVKEKIEDKPQQMDLAFDDLFG